MSSIWVKVVVMSPTSGSVDHRLTKTQIRHATDFTWYRGHRPSPAQHARVSFRQMSVLQNHAREYLLKCALQVICSIFTAWQSPFCRKDVRFVVFAALNWWWTMWQDRICVHPDCSNLNIGCRKFKSVHLVNNSFTRTVVCLPQAYWFIPGIHYVSIGTV